MKIIEESGVIKIFNEGVLIVEDNSYNNIILAIEEIKKVISDNYQLSILEEILKNIKKEVA